MCMLYVINMNSVILRRYSRGRDGERRMKTRCSTCIYID